MIRALLGTGLGLFLVLTGIGMLFAVPIIRLFAPEFASEKFALSIDLTRILFVHLFCIGGVALAMGVLHSLRHFTAPVLLNVAMIAYALGLSAYLAEPVISLAYGVVIGGACLLLWQIPALVRSRDIPPSALAT